MLQKLIKNAAKADIYDAFLGMADDGSLFTENALFDELGLPLDHITEFYNSRLEHWEKAIFGELEDHSNGSLIKKLSEENTPDAPLFWMPNWSKEDLKNLFWDNSDPDNYSEYISGLSEAELDKFLHGFINELNRKYDANTSYDWENMQHLLRAYTKEKATLAPSDIVGNCDFCSEDIPLALTVTCDNCDKEFCQNCNESENDSEIICPNCI